MNARRCLALVAALSIGAGGCVNKASSRAAAGIGAVMIAGAVIGTAVYEPAPPRDDAMWIHIDGGELLIAGTLLTGLALTISGGLGYIIADSFGSSRKPKPPPPAIADTSQRHHLVDD